MHSIENNALEVLHVRGGLARTLGKFYVHVGRQEIYAQANRDLLEELRQSAIVQGTRSSNGIEGIFVPEDRYDAIMSHRAEPLTRSEKDVAGYRDTLDYIHRNFNRIEVTPETIVDLHRRVYAHRAEPAGGWRQEQNYITRREGDGPEDLVYTPPPPSRVEPLVLGLCREYNRQQALPDTDPFLLLAGFVFDFTCIHPFMDGNGRVSRLLTVLLAYKAGFDVVRYISHERLIFETKSAYYYALTESSRHWLRRGHNWSPWLAYLADIFLKAYDELSERVSEVASGRRDYKRERLLEVIQDMPSQFTMKEILQALPTISRITAARVLGELREVGAIETVGAGPRAYYRKCSVIDGPTA